MNGSGHHQQSLAVVGVVGWDAETKESTNGNHVAGSEY